MDLICHDLGRRAYGPTLKLQERLADRVQARPAGPGFLLLVEHDPPVITTGRRPCAEQILLTPRALARQGLEVIATSRGGTVTYHGPGQLVAYPILRLGRPGLSVRQYVRGLEEAIIRVLGRYGIRAGRAEGMTGVWVDGAKVAAIGVAVSRWVAWHGLALNVSTDPGAFGCIVPCGLAGKPVTSLSRLLDRLVDIDEVKPLLVQSLCEVLNVRAIRRGRPPGHPAGGHDGSASSNARGADSCMRATTASIPSTGSPEGQGRPPLPPWLRKPLPAGSGARNVRDLLAELKLATVCTSALCPNRAECFSRHTATFLILGDRCTRSCRFCGVAHGEPLPLRDDEPEAVAQAAARLGLCHVVITSVTRDDLGDGGAGQFARTIRAVRERLGPAVRIEVLTPDFQGRHDDLDTVLGARTDVFNHNVETVPRLHPAVRPQADYRRSLGVLAHAKRFSAALAAGAPVASLAADPSAPGTIRIKSGLMLGLGETREEVLQTLRDLCSAGCDMVTIGQYLPPSADHFPVRRYVEPAEFTELKAAAREMGFSGVASGPFVRSSYQAGQVYESLKADWGQGVR